MSVSISFDMDGTIAELYGVQGWLEKLRTYDESPYREAEPMVNMSLLARYIHKAQNKGIKVNIISWCSKVSTEQYDIAVEQAKREWLKKHLPSVEFDEIIITPYGEPKQQYAVCDKNILFDDNEDIRADWGENAFEPKDIFEIIKMIIEKV